MNRYPLWIYIIVAISLALGLIYTIPNFYGEAPAVQISSAKATLKIGKETLSEAEQALKSAGITHTGSFLDVTSARFRFADTDTQLKAKDVISKALNPDEKDLSYTVALNLLSSSPTWLTNLHALPMYLGLDLRGGVHFLLQVDMKGALTKRLDSMAASIRTALRDKNLRHAGIERDGMQLKIRFRDAEGRSKARSIIEDTEADLKLLDRDEGGEFLMVGALKAEAEKRIQELAVKQNITTLHNRVNELGVAEPVIQQQGTDRIVVQLPGVQDVARAKELIGRTASLELRMVDEEQSTPAGLEAAQRGQVPFGTEFFRDRTGQSLLIKKQVVLTGDRLADAQPGFDQNQQPAVHLVFDGTGARIIRDVSRENIKKRMAILLIEKGKGEVITAPVIQSELGSRIQITGRMTPTETNDISILLRSGSLAAPMEIIEERTVGPSLGKENIQRGFNSTQYGFAAISVFMVAYYLMFGAISVIALAANLFFLVALLSLLQATLTLPGMAGIALTLGMAIDANVLINERIREELRIGQAPQSAIYNGYERAFGTILDSNVTTLIAGLALLVFGSGPVRGFAVVLCLGIATSIFSAVVVSRCLVNFWYGRRRKLEAVSIGQVHYS